MEQRLDLAVTYGTGQASVQTVVAELARQVGLQYNRQKSYQQTDPVCRHWVRDLVIRNKPCRQALDEVLSEKFLTPSRSAHLTGSSPCRSGS